MLPERHAKPLVFFNKLFYHYENRLNVSSNIENFHLFSNVNFLHNLTSNVKFYY